MKKIDELMDVYILEKEFDLGSESLSNKEKSQILAKTLKKANLNRGVKASFNRNRFRSLLIACIIILATFTLSFAAYHYIASEDALNFFKPDNEEELSSLNSVGTVINKQVSANGLTIDVKEAIGDRHSVNIIFDVIIPEDKIQEDLQYLFEETRVNISGGTSMGWHIEELSDNNPNDNIIPMLLSLDSRKKLIGREMTLNFIDFSCYNPEGESIEDWYTKLIEGNWSISFKLNYRDNSIVHKINEKIHFSSYTVTLKEITLSPISLSLKIKGSEIEKYDEEPPEDNSNERLSDHMTIKLKNGETFDKIFSSGMSTSFDTIIINYSFSEVLDLSQIDTIDFCDIQIDMKN
ncbi:DUF4179 domain-containing protein [Anaerovorax odorimutans]|uniref:DUF4179 domain-containing protein n=1 Tax=Anaerovorax odorimutans TaxID=109327 RepID=UPI0003F92404|nr:DUF4179 domain-containing protein [Anaerovorax odorimutans]